MDSKKLAALLKEAEKAYSDVQQEVNSFQTETDNLLEGFATRAKTTYDRFKKSEKESNDLNAVLLGQEIRGQKVDPEIVKRASDAEVECSKLRSAMRSIGAMAALASLHMGKKVSEAEAKQNEAVSSLRGFKDYSALFFDSALLRITNPVINAELAKRAAAAEKLKVEFDNKRSTLTVLKELASGKTASPDGGTLEGAQALINTAARAYVTRAKIRDQILAELEAIKLEEEALKERKAATYDALSASSPDMVHHLLTPIVPILDVNLYNDPTGNAGNMAELLLSRKARELETK